MLTELFAYQAAVLSFKADALAQESYIATAKTSEGLIKLLELIGISIRGPVPAKASARLTVEDASYAVTGAETMTINQSDRNVDMVSTRDNLPLVYTLYNVDPNGNIDMQAEEIILNADDFSTDGSYR